MARVRSILQSEFSYNITARCINREWFQVPLDDVWEIFSEELARTSSEHNLLAHAFVLMSNHFHLIASTPDANISQCMHQFMQPSSRRLTRKGNRINQTFAGRHYKSVMHTPNYYLNAYKYVYRNPVTAGICARVEDYKYSTLPFVIRKRTPIFRLAEDRTYLSDPVGTLQWLNTEPTAEKLDAFRCGTRRQFFRSKKCRRTGSLILSPEDLL